MWFLKGYRVTGLQCDRVRNKKLKISSETTIEDYFVTSLVLKPLLAYYMG